MALPFLHSVPEANAAVPKSGEKPSRKLVIMYIPNGIVRRCFFPGEEEAELPGFVGGFNADKTKDKKRIQNVAGIYPLELTSTMQPLQDLTKDVTLITGLDRTFKNGQDVHAQGASCYLTSLSPVQAAEKNIRYPNGRSLDQVIGDAVGASTVYKTLEISTNGFKAGKESIYFDNISWYGPDKIAPSIRDPKKLYDRLFMADSYRTHVTDVTDLMLADAKALHRKLSVEDRETLGEFMTMVRDVEVRIKKLQSMLADADIAAGQKVAKKCTACHVFEKGGQNKVGPALWNIVNAGKGQIDGYGYSEALGGFGGVWDYQSLNQFFYKPKAYISGTKMNFAGLKKPADRANLIAYLRSQADQPAALPTSDEIAVETQ